MCLLLISKSNSYVLQVKVLKTNFESFKPYMQLFLTANALAFEKPFEYIMNKPSEAFD